MKILPAGHIMEVQRDGAVKPSRYFAPLEMFDEVRYNKNTELSEDDLLAELSHLVEQSVQRHLVSDVPSGVLLSGGIDSSSVFSYAIEQDPDIQTFTKISPGIENIPLKVVPELLRQRPATSHYVVQRQEKFVQGLENFIGHTKAPSRWNSGPSMTSLCQCARDNGVITLLGGDCVDEFFGGYIHYQEYFKNQTSVKDLGELVSYPENSELHEGKAYLKEQKAVRSEILDKLDCLPNNSERLAHATMMHDTATFLQTCTLPHSDAYSMMASVELRNPMLDFDLVSFALNLPAKFRSATHPNGEFGKVLFRKLAVKRMGEFTNVKKEGTRNYAMSMAEARFWHLDRFAIFLELAGFIEKQCPGELIFEKYKNLTEYQDFTLTPAPCPYSKAESKNFRFEQIGAHDLGQLDEKFDIFYAKAIDHIPDWEGIFKAINLVANDDAVVVIKHFSFFAYLGPHRYATTNIPWGHLLLSDDEYRRFAQEFHAERADQMVDFYFNGLAYPRTTMSQLTEIARQNGFAMHVSITEPNRSLTNYFKFIDDVPEFWEMVRENHPEVSVEEMFSGRCHMVFKRYS